MFFVHVIGKTMPTTALWTEAIAEPVIDWKKSSLYKPNQAKSKEAFLSFLFSLCVYYCMYVYVGRWLARFYLSPASLAGLGSSVG